MTAPAPFSNLAGKCFLACVLGNVAAVPFPWFPVFIVNLICLWRMFDRARNYDRSAIPGFDPVVAAEAMVGFGVVSLVLGLTAVALHFVLGYIDLNALQQGDRSALFGFLPFAEGLATAGFAPFFAILLRLTVSERGFTVDAADDMDGLARAAVGLTKAMNAAAASVETLRTGAAAAGGSTAGLATAMKTEADRWGLALQEGQAHVKTFGEAARSGSGQVSELADETSRLKAATADTTRLLEELARLIEQVERFVGPRRARR